jgi:class 3 adenylate cyclase/predicted ATPase
MTCPACGTENEAGRKFCAECGAKLALACPSCGTSNSPGAKFCGECGAPLAAQPKEDLPSPPASPTAERRLVSVLFADLVGFTTLSESRDAEEVRDLLSRYFDTCKRLISLYGGTVEKFIGDAVMAVWGTPVAQEDDAERAVRAALDLVAAVSALGDEVGAPELRARAGVLTGEAAVTIGAEGQGMVAGDLVNTASRIQSSAEPGSVLVGESTKRASEAAIAYADAGAQELKGKAEPVPLFRALRVTAGRAGALKAEGLEPPFVGRDRELRQIKDLFHVSADEKKPQLVSVTGIAGIGKSRLAWEFYKYFDGIAENVYWHRGRCLSYGEGVTYWALADMVRMRCRIGEDEEPDSSLAKLRAALDEHILDSEERRFAEPRLAQLLGLGEHKVGDKQDLFAAWRLFFERLAETYPTVLVFEDVQWADASLLDFVEYLLEWSRERPLFVLTLARPELHERRPNWGAGHRNFTSLYLESLSQTAMEELLAGIVPGLPRTIRDQILARAEGVPLYAVETVRMLLDRGLLGRVGNAYHVTGPLETLDVPETLHALIAARLDGLSADERRLLQDGAVLGKTFTRDAAAALSGLSQTELERLLSSLVRKEVLGVQADPRSPEHGQYGFLQDLVRHVTYETLSKRERRARHLAAAAHLESAFPEEDEIVEVLASHYLDAYRLAPEAGDGEEVMAKARDALIRAGERAESLGAPGEAQRYLEHAAALAHEPSSRAELLARAGWLASYAADYDAASRLLGEAAGLYEAEGDTHAWARASGRLSLVERFQGRSEQALARAERAFDVVAADEPDEDVASLAAALGAGYLFAGDHERGSERLEFALGLAQSLGSADLVSRTLSTKSIVLARQGRPEEALGLLKHGLAIALENELWDQAYNLYFNLSDLLFQRDRYSDALEHLSADLELARRRGNRPGEWSLLAETTYPLYMTGRWEEALAAAAELPEEGLRLGLTLSLLATLLEIYCHRGQLDDARRLLGLYADLDDATDVQDRAAYVSASAAIRRAEGRPENALSAGVEAAEISRGSFGAGTQSVKQGLVEAIEAAFTLGQRERVEELLATVEGIAPGLRPPYLDAQAHRFRARLAEEEAAERSYENAAERFRGLGIPFWLAVTLLEHGEWLAGQDRAAEAEPLLAEAREIFDRLEAKPWLERVERALEKVGVPA